MRTKSNLITRVPLKGLCQADFEKVKAIDPRYLKFLDRSSEKSWHQIRREIKPYIITTNVYEKDLTYMTKTKTEAVKEFRKRNHSAIKITKIIVEYENRSKELAVYKSKKVQA